MEKRIDFKVSLVLPEGATATHARVYVRDAVAAWRGSLRPVSAEHAWYDPMFYLDAGSVRVTRLKEQPK